MFLFIIISILQILNANELDNQFDGISFGMANKVTEFNGKLYCATGNGYDGGLYIKNSGGWELYSQKDLMNNAIRDLLVINENLIIATDKGMFFLNSDNNLTEINTELPNEIKNRNSNRVLKIQKYQDSLYINIDNKFIYYANASDLSNVIWKKYDTDISENFYDFAIYKNDIYISFLSSGMKRYNLNTKIRTDIPQIKEEFIVRLFTSDDYLVAVTVLENLISTNGLNWENLNSKFNLNSDIIKYFYQSGNNYYITDNTNLFSSSNNGASWSFFNVSQQVNSLILTLDIFEKNNEVYISTNDFGVLKIANNELSKEKIFNYNTGKFLNYEDDIFYNISTLNLSYIFKNDESVQSFLIYNDTIIDYDIEGNFIYALTQFNGLIKTNGFTEEYIKLPEYYDMNLYNLQKICVIDTMIFLFNGVSKTETKPTMCYITKDKGETWEGNYFVADTTLGYAKIGNELYIIDKGEFSAGITHYDYNTDTWDIVSGTDKLDAMMLDNIPYYLIDGKMFYFDGFFEQVGNSDIKISKMISNDYALFEDKTIKNLKGEQWETVIPLNILDEYNINEILKIDANHLRYGTNAYGIFDLFIEQSNVIDNYDELFTEKDNLIYSEKLFNLKVYNLNGKLIDYYANIFKYDKKLLKENFNILLFEIDNKIIIKKIYKI